jgi:hypothetical protein
MVCNSLRPRPRFSRLAAIFAPLAFGASAAVSQVQSVPTPTPAPASSLPSIAAPAPQSTLPPPPVAPGPTPPAPVYKDPLREPIVVPATVPPVVPAAVPENPNPAPTAPPVTLDQPTAVQPAALPPQPTAVEMPQAATVASVANLPALPAYDFEGPSEQGDHFGSAYIPVDSAVYPMALRLYSMGYLDTAFINMRPWTRRSLLHMLQNTAVDIENEGDDQAQQILARLMSELSDEMPAKGFTRGRVYGIESAYTRFMGIGGTPLRDSYHIGQSLVNDYARPYASGFNNITGVSSLNEMGRFSLYIRGEYQHAPSSAGYSLALANTLSCIDEICPFAPPNDPQATIPYGKTVDAQNPFRLQEATLSFHLLGHEISGGKSDAWLGPNQGGSLAWSDNAENIYSFRIDRVEPLHIPWVSAVLGPLRYDFFVGSLKGHTYPNDPWVHSSMFSFAPTANFQFGFERTVIWGGKGHEPITLHTFLKSFFDINDTTPTEKSGPNDPGARYSVFNFSWRLPFVRRYATLTLDSIAHDDVTPISAPRRASYRTGIYISQFPHLPKLDFRLEGISTDPPVTVSMNGGFNYYEIVQRQGYTNKGFIMGDWIGREAKGGQAWLTYHLSADEWIQIEYLNKKIPKDFIPLGTTQNSFKVDFVKHLPRNITMDAWMQFERWKAPVYIPGPNSDTAVAAQFTWRPRLHAAPVAK